MTVRSEYQKDTSNPICSPPHPNLFFPKGHLGGEGRRDAEDQPPKAEQINQAVLPLEDDVVVLEHLDGAVVAESGVRGRDDPDPQNNVALVGDYCGVPLVVADDDHVLPTAGCVDPDGGSKLILPFVERVDHGVGCAIGKTIRSKSQKIAGEVNVLRHNCRCDKSVAGKVRQSAAQQQHGHPMTVQELEKRNDAAS